MNLFIWYACMYSMYAYYVDDRQFLITLFKLNAHCFMVLHSDFISILCGQNKKVNFIWLNIVECRALCYTWILMNQTQQKRLNFINRMRLITLPKMNFVFALY